MLFDHYFFVRMDLLCVYVNMVQREGIVNLVFLITGIDPGGELLQRMLGNAKVRIMSLYDGFFFLL